MHKVEKTILSAVFVAALTVTQGFAQTPKKVVKPAPAVKKAPVTAKAPAPKGPVLKTTMDSLSAAIGVSFSNSIASQGIEGLNTDVLTQTIQTALKGGKTPFSSDSANMFLASYFQKQMEVKNAPVKAEGEKFLAENKSKPGIITTESGLQYQVIKMGEGPKPAATDRVKTHYHGTLINGTVFDSSVQRGEPIDFGVNQVIKGWTEALQLMPVGSKFKLFIPYQLAYGERGAGGQIPPYSALIFEVELLEIVK